MTKTNALAAFMTDAQTPEKAPSVPFTVADSQGQANKLTFISARCRNFRGVGDNWIEIDFLRNQSTLVASDDNGAGKSTMNVWLPYYGLTGKPYGDKEKVTGLVNSINNKNMITENVFSLNGRVYKVIRGRKPDIFEIRYLDGDEFKLIQDDAASGDWQDYLYSILGLDKKNAPKIIENVIILGKDKFKPFIEMGAEDRRTMVETIWDLGIFSTMNEVAKESRKKEIGVRFEKESEINTEEQNLDKRVSLKAASEQSRDNAVATYDASNASAMATKAQLQAQCEADGAKVVDETPFQAEYDSVLTRSAAETQSLDAGLETELAKYKSELDSAKDTHEGIVTEVSADVITTSNESQAKLAANDEDALVKVGVFEAKKTELEDQLVAKQAEQTGLLDKLPEFNTKLEGARKLVDEQQAIIDQCSQNGIKLDGYNGRFSGQIADFQKRLDDYNAMGVCPSCNQQVTDGAKQGVADEIQPKIDMFTQKQGELHEQIKTNTAELAAAKETHKEATTKLEELQREISLASSDAQDIKFAIRNLTSDIARLAEQIAGVEAERVRNAEVINNATADKGKALDNRLRDAQAAYDKVVDGYDDRVQAAKDRVTLRKHDMDDEVIAAEKRMKDGIAAANKVLTDNIERSSEALSRHTNTMIQADERHEAELAEMDKNIAYESDVIAKIEAAIKVMNQEYHELNESVKDWADLLVLISDKEGKADIIRQYLPFLNAKINDYCESLGLFINFAMDDKFAVSMNAPDRKGQSLFSLSTGQRARVNLAILFALRDVANLKASIQTNLLVLDEILESLSEQGALEATTMIKTKFQDSNLFVVSQRESEFEEYFDSKIKYGLRGGFTTVI